MDFTNEIRARLSVRQPAPDEAVVEELAQHASASFEAARADGLSVVEADARVRALIEAWCSDARRISRRPRRASAIELESPTAAARGWIGFPQDLRYGLRLARRQPGATLLVVALIALGVGAAATLCALTYSVLLKPLPWSDPDRLVMVVEVRDGATRPIVNTVTNATYLSWRETPETIEAVAGYSSRMATVGVDGDAERVRVMTTTASLFPLLRAFPVAGALFTQGDETPSRAHVALVSFGLWQRRLGGRSDAVGRAIEIDGERYGVVGVMSRDFAFPNRDVQVWTPLHVTPVLDPANPQSRSVSLFRSIARLKPGVTPAQASAEATARGRAAPDLGMVGTAVFGTEGKPRVTATPYLEAQTADVRPALYVMVAAVGLLLLVAIANIAGMQLARAITRRREVAIRCALGAGAGRLIRQLLAENLVVGLAGGAAAWTIAVGLLQALPRLLPSDFPRAGEIDVDWRVFAFALVTAIAASLVFGVGPAVIARRLNVTEALVEDNLAPVGGGLRTPAGRLRAAIMVGQVAVTAILLVGAALFARSFVALISVDRGYNPHNLLTATLPMVDRRFTSERRAATLDSVLDRLDHVPGVVAAAGASVMPLLPYDQPIGFRLPASAGQPGAAVQANLRTISPGYFNTLGMQILEGRSFSESDTRESQKVVVVNQAFVRKYLSGSPIGARLPITFDKTSTGWQEIIGVVDDVRHQSATEPPQPELFALYRQIGEGMRMSAPALVVRTTDDPAALVPTLRRIVREQDTALALDSVMTMENRLLSSLARPRLYSIVLAVFAGFALLVAGAGLFGVLSYNVAQRTREIGVRAALGAKPVDIMRLIARQGILITAAGVTIGLLAAYELVTLVGKLLYGVTARDPISFVAASMLIGLVASIATVAPVRRAARIEPLKALKQ